MSKNKPQTKPHAYIKINSKWIINIKNKSIKLLGKKNVGEKSL